MVKCSIELYHLVSFCMLKENQLQVLRLKEKIADKAYIRLNKNNLLILRKINFTTVGCF